ncbi:Uncharacterized protein TCM_019762 [Theobroma cacao]|uniref:Uncharacterized protein n=1 Tax=Theobroma cacao TaxID=3641 RepID=A0A061EI22_THECC|nr:Uncharacterized protein TCM_019762 [Theobroma cacao]
MDGIMLINEIIHSMRHKLHNDGGIILKLDFEKAFDCVDWGYLLCVMQSMGFRQKWCSWIYKCNSTVRVSILVNGFITSEFPMKRGFAKILGNDTSIYFLFDKWLEDTLLSSKYPRLFSFALVKDMRVLDAWINRVCSIIFKANLYSREESDYEGISNSLSSIALILNKEDGLVWNMNLKVSTDLFKVLFSNGGVFLASPYANCLLTIELDSKIALSWVKSIEQRS